MNCMKRRDSEPTAITFHMHDDKPSTEPVAQDLMERLWSCSHQLTDSDAATLAVQGKGTCTICLLDMSGGEEIVFVPCEGEHALHFQCLRQWFEKASTCPSCRFQLPTQARAAAEAETIDALVDTSLAAMTRLRIDSAASVAPPPPPASRTASTGAADLIADLEKRAESLAEQLRCNICEDAPRAVAFQCGHRFCEACAERVQTCPTCRRPVSMRIRCFD